MIANHKLSSIGCMIRRSSHLHASVQKKYQLLYLKLVYDAYSYDKVRSITESQDLLPSNRTPLTKRFSDSVLAKSLHHACAIFHESPVAATSRSVIPELCCKVSDLVCNISVFLRAMRNTLTFLYRIISS